MASSSISDADLRVLAKLFVMLDSPQEGDATAAVVRVRAMLRKGGMALYQAVETQAFKTAIWEAMGHPECLREYFEAARLRQDFAKLDKECDELAEAVTKLREVGKFCRSCESKRRMIGLVFGADVMVVWCVAYPPFEVSLKMTGYGILLGLTPLLCVFGRWRVHNFKRDVEWVSVTDNNLYRGIADRWNGFLERLALKR